MAVATSATPSRSGIAQRLSDVNQNPNGCYVVRVSASLESVHVSELMKWISRKTLVNPANTNFYFLFVNVLFCSSTPICSLRIITMTSFYHPGSFLECLQSPHRSLAAIPRATRSDASRVRPRLLQRRRCGLRGHTATHGRAAAGRGRADDCRE